MAKRWRRWVLVTLVVVAVMLLVAWMVLPSAVVAVARGRLPRPVSSTLTVTDAATTLAELPALGMARVVVTASAGRIGAIAKGAGRPVPEILLRDGMCARATWSDAKHAPELPLELLAAVRRDADPPSLVMAVPAAPLAALIARTAEPVEFAGSTLRWSYRLDPGSVLAQVGPPEVTPTGIRRRFRAEAAGLVTAQLNDAMCEVRVTRLVGHVDLDLDRRGDGWHVHGTLAVETLESKIERCTSPLLEKMAGNLKSILELLLNTNVLSEHARRNDVLPLWFPVDLSIQAVVAAEPGDCAAAVAAMLPLR